MTWMVRNHTRRRSASSNARSRVPVGRSAAAQNDVVLAPPSGLMSPSARRGPEQAPSPRGYGAATVSATMSARLTTPHTANLAQMNRRSGIPRTARRLRAQAKTTSAGPDNVPTTARATEIPLALS